MNGLPPVSTRTVTLFPYPTLFRSTLAEWPLELIPDSPPEVTFLSAPQRTERAALRLNYQAKDDYGLAEVKAVVRRLDQPEAEPLELEVALPGGTPELNEASSYHDLTPHPWAGLAVAISTEEHTSELQSLMRISYAVLRV